MLFQQVSNSSLQQLRVDTRICYFQKHSLVPVMRIGQVLVKEPVLNGCQRNPTASYLLLVRCWCWRAGNCHLGQCSDCLVLENLPGAEEQSSFAHSRYNQQAKNRISPRFEEIRIYIRLLDFEYLRPGIGDYLFGRGARRNGNLQRRLPPFRSRECSTIELAVERHRQCV